MWSDITLSRIYRLSLARPTCAVEKFGLVLGFLLSVGLPESFVQAEVAPAGSYLDAQSLIRDGKWAEAVLVLRRALEEQPRFLPAQLQYAAALVRLDRRSEALASLNRWAAVEKDAHKDRLVERIHVLSRIFLTHDSSQAYLDGVSYIAASKFGDAKAKLQQAYEKEKDNFEVLLRIGQAQVLTEDYDSAVERLKLSTLLDPFEPEARLWLGRALTKRSEVSAGLQELRTAQSGLPKSELAPSWLAEALALAGQPEVAIGALERDLHAHSDHWLSQITLTRIQLEAASLPLASLKQIRQNLQALLESWQQPDSRLRPNPEGELGVSVNSLEDLKKGAQSLLQTVDTRIERAEGG